MPLRASLGVVVCLVTCLCGVSCGQLSSGDGQSAANAPIAAPVLAVGDMAPDFTLPGSDGKQYSLASYRGKQSVVLAWFSKAFTEG
jgi:cytochrome oxidase Cu insertion factor (SCO1/SenC/PrrC family)